MEFSDMTVPLHADRSCIHAWAVVAETECFTGLNSTPDDVSPKLTQTATQSPPLPKRLPCTCVNSGPLARSHILGKKDETKGD